MQEYKLKKKKDPNRAKKSFAKVVFFIYFLYLLLLLIQSY